MVRRGVIRRQLLRSVGSCFGGKKKRNVEGGQENKSFGHRVVSSGSDPKGGPLQAELVGAGSAH